MNVFLSKFLKDGDVALVGVSGGADSMCLLDLLFLEKQKINFRLVCVHVNHQLRGAEADRDEKLVQEFCEKRKIEFECARVDAAKRAKEEKKTIEEAARELRYEVFARLKKKYHATKIFVAHNKNDQAETVLMHILRGSGMAGAGGMASDKNGIARPLLGVSRAEIEEYVKSRGLPFAVDSTNLDSSFSRNKVRLCLMPKLAEAYPRAMENLAAFGELASADEEFICSLLPLEKLESGRGFVVINLSAASLEKSLFSRLIICALRMLDAEKDIFKVHIEKLENLFFQPCGKRVSLPNGLEASRVAKGVKIRKIEAKKSVKSQNFALKSYKMGDFAFEVEQVAAPKTFEKGMLYFDYDKVGKSAIFRTRQSGDTFRKLGSSGKKSFSDYLTDMKVDRDLRDNLIVLADGHRVLLTIGLDVSEDIKIDKNTKKVCRLKSNLTKSGKLG